MVSRKLHDFSPDSRDNDKESHIPFFSVFTGLEGILCGHSRRGKDKLSFNFLCAFYNLGIKTMRAQSFQMVITFEKVRSLFSLLSECSHAVILLSIVNGYGLVYLGIVFGFR